MKTAIAVTIVSLFVLFLMLPGCGIVPAKQAKTPDGALIYLDPEGKATLEAKDVDGKDNPPLMLHDVEKVENAIQVAADVGSNVPIVGDWWKMIVGGLGVGIGVPILRKINEARLKKAGVPAEPRTT